MCEKNPILTNVTVVCFGHESVWTLPESRITILANILMSFYNLSEISNEDSVFQTDIIGMQYLYGRTVPSVSPANSFLILSELSRFVKGVCNLADKADFKGLCGFRYRVSEFDRNPFEAQTIVLLFAYPCLKLSEGYFVTAVKCIFH